MIIRNSIIAAGILPGLMEPCCDSRDKRRATTIFPRTLSSKLSVLFLVPLFPRSAGVSNKQHCNAIRYPTQEKFFGYLGCDLQAYCNQLTTLSILQALLRNEKVLIGGPLGKGGGRDLLAMVPLK